MSRPKERYFKETQFPDEPFLIKASEYIFDFFLHLKRENMDNDEIEDPRKMSLSTLIKKGSEILSNDEDYFEVDSKGNKI